MCSAERHLLNTHSSGVRFLATALFRFGFDWFLLYFDRESPLPLFFGQPTSLMSSKKRCPLKRVRFVQAFPMPAFGTDLANYVFLAVGAHFAFFIRFQSRARLCFASCLTNASFDALNNMRTALSMRSASLLPGTSGAGSVFTWSDHTAD